MPLNSDGTYTRSNGVATGSNTWQETELAGRDVESALFDAEGNDIKGALDGMVRRDGSNSPSQNLPMNGKKHTNVGNATERNEYPSWGQVQDRFSSLVASNVIVVNTVSRSTTNIVLTPSATTTSLSKGQLFVFQSPGGRTTGNVSIQVTGVTGTITARYRDGSTALAWSAVPQNTQVVAYYNGSEFITNINQPSAVSGSFDLHDDVTTEASSVNGSDRILVSKEDVSGDPNQYATFNTIRSFFLSKNNALNALSSSVSLNTTYRQVASVSITPTRANRKMMFYMGIAGANAGTFKIQRNGTDITSGIVRESSPTYGNDTLQPFVFPLFYDETSTSAVTYTLWGRVNSGTSTVQSGSYFFVEEIEKVNYEVGVTATDITIRNSSTVISQVSLTPLSASSQMKISVNTLFRALSSGGSAGDIEYSIQRRIGSGSWTNILTSADIDFPFTSRTLVDFTWFDAPNTTSQVSYRTVGTDGGAGTKIAKQYSSILVEEV